MATKVEEIVKCYGINNFLFGNYSWFQIRKEILNFSHKQRSSSYISWITHWGVDGQKILKWAFKQKSHVFDDFR